MTRDRLDNPEHLLREAAWLAGLSRCLVHDPAAADDLYQETVLAALRRGATVRGGMRPWLAGVARKVAGSWHRSEARRVTRERAVAADEAQPSTAEVVERAAMHREVFDAVMALAEPYRTTVLLRFFDDLPAVEVARRTGVPLETARTRLKRGLVMLRHRLDALYGSRAAWLAPVTALARIDGPGLAVGAGAGVWSVSLVTSVVLLMNSKLVTAALAAVAVTVWGFWPDSPPGSPSPDQPEIAGASVEALTGGPTPSPDAAAGVDHKARHVLPAAGVGEADPGRAVLIGRCVDDATGQPVAGLLVTALVPRTSTVHDSVRGRFERPQVQPARQPPPTATDSDGRFEVVVPLAAKHRYTVGIAGHGYVPLEQAQVALEPGQRLDLGEGRMLRGASVRGEVVDTDGKPVAGAAVRLRFGTAAIARVRIGLTAVDSPRQRTDEDGRFVTTPVPFGAYGPWVEYPHRLAQELREPLQVIGDATFIRLIVLPDRGWIRGVVVDAAGVPVEGARIETRPAATRHRILTDAAGAFAVPRFEPGVPAAVRLVAAKAGYPKLCTESLHGWADPPVRLVLRPGAAQEIRVVEADGRTPVSRFGGEPLRRWHETSLEFRRDAVLDRVVERPQGLARTEGLEAGRYIIVLSSGPDGDRRSLHDIEIGTQPARHLLTLPPRRLVPVQVVFAAGPEHGKPVAVAGTRFQLIQTVDGVPYQRGFHLFDPHRLRTFGLLLRVKTGIILEEGVTTADGRARLQVPDVAGVHLLVLGPGHAPIRLPAAQLRAAGEELVIEVQRGARLRGHLSPRSVERRLRPALRLVDVADASRIFPDEDSWAPSGQPGSHVDSSGNYELLDVPPGDWKVYLMTFSASGGSQGSVALEHVGTVRGLLPGEQRTEVLDCRHLLPCAFEGTAWFAGAPAAFVRIKLTTGAKPDRKVVVLDADEHGRFAGEITAGTYAVTAEVRVDGRAKPQPVVCRAGLELSPGQRVVRKLEFVAR